MGAQTKRQETKRPETKRPETKRPETKRPETKHPETKHPGTKCPEGQNFWRDKISGGTKLPADQMYMGTKHPKT
jgi:hypothetical protein